MRVDTTTEIGTGAGAEICPFTPAGTPTINTDLVQRLGGFTTLCEGLDYAAQGQTGMNFYGPRGQLDESVTYHQLRKRAIAAAHQLVNAGIKPGERVGVVAETGADFMVVFFGCQYAGMVPCPLPYSMYIGGRESYVTRIAGMLESAHATAVVTTAELDELVRDAAGRAGVKRVLSHEQLAGFSSEGPALAPFGPEDISYIQYSSGSTSNPKGVLISQKSACANTMAILRHGLKIRPTDRAFSWLPLYHDMGLVGFCLSPMMGQVSVDYLSTPAFARRPALWLKLMSQNQCTIAYGPSFGYDLAARRANGSLGDLKLDQWRVAGIGGDMVRADVLKLFAETLGVAGFKSKAFLPSYGMAESTLGVCFADSDEEIQVDVIDRAAMKEYGVAEVSSETDPDLVRSFVVCGRPLPAHKMRVVNVTGKELADREIGCIEIAGPSLMSGYFRNDAATSAIKREDGFMDTGDMGYWLDGEIVITGRAKDMILHNGRNIWPQDIEWSVEKLGTVRDGDVAAFAVEGSQGEDCVCVLVQCRLRNDDEVEAVRKAVKAQISRTIGIEAQVVMVPPKSLPFTSSGKLSRSGAKTMFTNGDIVEIVDGPDSIDNAMSVAAE
ncbi:MAG: fatty acyl-AMP ligase [Anderseniella sp.]